MDKTLLAEKRLQKKQYELIKTRALIIIPNEIKQKERK